MYERLGADVEARDVILTLAVTQSLKGDLRRAAFQRGESMSSVAREILEQGLVRTPYALVGTDEHRS